MGRILSGSSRAMDVADPGAGGKAGMCRRSRIMRDVELAADDMITILRMSPSDRLKDHVRRQVARVVEFDGGAVAAEPAGLTASGADDMVDGSADHSTGGDDADSSGCDLENSIWGE